MPTTLHKAANNLPTFRYQTESVFLSQQTEPQTGLKVYKVIRTLQADKKATCKELRGLDTLGRFSATVLRETFFCDFLFAFQHTKPIPNRDLLFNPSLAEHDMPCLSKQCRSRSVGF